MPWVLALLGHFLSWTVMKGIRAGGSLTGFQRALLFFQFFFVVGIAYSMMLVFRLDLPRPLWLVLTVVWGAVIGKITQKHYQRNRDQSQSQTDAGGDHKEV